LKSSVQDRGKGAAIVPVMLGDAKLSQVMADRLLDEGIYVIGFFYPVVPKDTARIRVQLSAAHEPGHIDQALTAFGRWGRSSGSSDRPGQAQAFDRLG
jgi:glycine C-acetyltransferase